MTENYGICICGKWGKAPAHFRENKHFIKCPSCGEPMYLTRTNAIEMTRDLGYRVENKVEPTETINHNG